MLSLAASTSCAPSGTCSASSVAASRNPSSTPIASVAALLGAEPLGRLQIDLPSRAAVKAVVTADHPIPAAIRADLSAREKHWRNWLPTGC